MLIFLKKLFIFKARTAGGRKRCVQLPSAFQWHQGWWGVMEMSATTQLLWLVSTSCALHHALLTGSLHLSSSGWWKEGAVLTQVQQNTKNLGFLPLLWLRNCSGLALYSVAAVLQQPHTWESRKTFCAYKSFLWLKKNIKTSFQVFKNLMLKS